MWLSVNFHRAIINLSVDICTSVQAPVFQVCVFETPLPPILSPPQAQSTPLHISTSSGHLHIVILLIQTSYCDVNAVNNQEQTALFFASTKNWIEVTVLDSLIF